MFSETECRHSFLLFFVGFLQNAVQLENGIGHATAMTHGWNSPFLAGLLPTTTRKTRI
jgi:hypothetical protein